MDTKTANQSTSNNGEQPPICCYDISEKSLLSCAIKQPSILGEPEFDDSLLYRESHRLILAALRDIWDYGQADNSVAYNWETVLRQYFSRHPDIAKMGGIEELSAIYGMEPLGKDSNGRDGWLYHVELLKQACSLRQCYFTSLRLEELARTRPPDYLDQCRLALQPLGASIEATDSVPHWLKPVPAPKLNRTKPPIVISGLLYQGQKLMVTAGSKSMKTWVLLTLAFCIANALDFLGFPTRRHRVLYLDFELQEWEAGTRLDMIRDALGKGNLDALHVWMRDPDAGIDLVPHEKADHFTLEMTPRSFKKPDPFVVRWEFPLLKRDQDTNILDPEKLKPPQRLNAQKWTDSDIIELLRPHDGAWSRYDLQHACVNELGMSKPTASERVNKLIKAKTLSLSKLDKNNDGDPVLLLSSSAC